MKKYIGICSMDSWHIANGIHQPNLWTTGLWETFEDVANKFGNELERLGYTDSKGNFITAEYLIDQYNKANSDYLRMEVFDGNREGIIIIEEG
jgi:hypothetical protein